jgi:hypothetical protein
MLDQLLDDAWGYHDTQSERLAGELEAAAADAVPLGLVVRFVQLATHTIGEHLGDWPRALTLGQRVVGGHAASAQIGKACESLYVAAVLAGDGIVAAELELASLEAAADRLASLIGMRFLLANALLGAHREAGTRLYRRALAFATSVEGSRELDRAIAVTSNNLAWTLHDLPSRTADDDACMQLAAEASLAAWRRCGTWINEELALYLQASVALATGDATTALGAAAAGLAVIAAHGQRPLDAARLHLLRARAFAAVGDAEGHASALGEADRAAATIASTDLQRQFAAERAKVG